MKPASIQHTPLLFALRRIAAGYKRPHSRTLTPDDMRQAAQPLVFKPWKDEIAPAWKEHNDALEKRIEWAARDAMEAKLREHFDGKP